MPQTPPTPPGVREYLWQSLWAAVFSGGDLSAWVDEHLRKAERTEDLFHAMQGVAQTFADGNRKRDAAPASPLGVLVAGAAVALAYRHKGRR